MARYFRKSTKNFVVFPEGQVDPSQIGTSKEYRLLNNAEETRYETAISQNLPPNEDWVFNDIWNYAPLLLLRAKEGKLESLNTNYNSRLNQGFTAVGKNFGFDEITRDVISRIEAVIQKENDLKDADPTYTRTITSVTLYDTTGVQVNIGNMNTWNTFFVAYSNSFLSLVETYQEKKWYLTSETDISKVENYDVTL